MIKVYFDGYCALCQRSVQFIEKFGEANQFQMISQQSKEGRAFMQSEIVVNSGDDSLWIQSHGQSLNKSSAAFEIAAHLVKPYRWIRYFAVLPSGLSDWLYDLIANNRYGIFGKVSHE